VRNAYSHVGDAAPSRSQRTTMPEEAVIQYSAAWRGVAWRGVAWRGVAWRGVAWRGVAWRGVAWRGVAFA
jgi:hypothetical protein